MEAGEERDMIQFFTFEGIDGSGKSTISKLVYEKLISHGYQVVLTYEPTDTEIGKFVQHCIKTNADPFVTAFVFIADRRLHCQQMKNWLDNQYIVLCDRYAESTYAYQGAQLEKYVKNPVKWLKELSKGILIPDKTFLFEIDPKIALSRIQNRSELIPFERLSFLQEVHKNYLKISKENRFIRVDGTKAIDELVTICYEEVISG